MCGVVCVCVCVCFFVSVCGVCVNVCVVAWGGGKVTRQLVCLFVKNMGTVFKRGGRQVRSHDL